MLKYLFTAEYRDGSLFKQPSNDVSEKDPQRSAFYDVDHNNLVGFCLSSGDCIYGVDLRDGHFEVNGIPFFMYDGELKDFKLVFFRRHLHHVTLGGSELSHEVTYRLGWRATDTDGNTVERIMEFM